MFESLQMIALYIAAIMQCLLGCATDESLLFSGCLASGRGYGLERIRNNFGIGPRHLLYT